MYATNLLLAAASLASIVVSQSTTSTIQGISEISDGQPQVPSGASGSVTLSSYSADSPSYTPPPADTSTFPAFSSASSQTSSSVVITSASSAPTSNVIPTQPGTDYNSTHSPLITASSSPASNYTLPSSKMPAPITFSPVSSMAVGTTSTGPTSPLSSTNAAAGAFRRVAGTGLALIVSGSLFSIFL